jgi:putative colanic acid biosynthesis acetyltransferase WcaF
VTEQLQALPPRRQQLRAFRGAGYDKGRPKLVQAAWFATSNLVFQKWWLPASARPRLLRLFGAEVGADVVIRHRVRIHWPWKLAVGAGSWLGEGVWIINLERVEIGVDVCVSQEALLCSGGHDRRSPTFEYANAPVVLEDESWVAARATVLPGVTVGRGAVVAAGAVVAKDVPAFQLDRGAGRG